MQTVVSQIKLFQSCQIKVDLMNVIIGGNDSLEVPEPIEQVYVEQQVLMEIYLLKVLPRDSDEQVQVNKVSSIEHKLCLSSFLGLINFCEDFFFYGLDRVLMILILVILFFFADLLCFLFSIFDSLVLFFYLMLISHQLKTD